MNFTPFLLPAVLTLALVIMFVVGLRSLATINRPRPVPPSPVGAPASAHRAQHATTPDRLDEWEANAYWPEHVAHAPGGIDEDPRVARPSVDQHTSPAAPVHTDDIHEESRGALDDELSDMFGPFIREPQSRTTAPSSTVTPSSPTDTLRCPHCRSSRIDTRNRARKAGSTIGSVAGATGAMTAALAGAETGAVVGSIAGPIGTIFGGLAGAVIAGLLGSAAGCAAGSAVGAAIDENVLDNHQCLACGHTFSVR
ncbi:hypothetical protein NDK50_14830 [Paraburkholderia bryophila]|uniref:hypothetical protein n=1 Tax=Paraburkholderia bryophila TaxID=420952 RepID=UPI00234AE794|nr:hypothetical protein [Paraburkholderia bryophila]WCM18709.1 hypothetical protein NDK50_14830 [Paraburkholderia bryophila]